MSSLLIEQISEFHDLIVKVAKTGIAIEVDGRTQPRQLRRRLDDLLIGFERRIARGANQDQLVAPDSDVPETYRKALAAWLCPGGSLQAMQILAAATSAKQELRADFRTAWLRSIALIILASLVFSVLLTQAVPPLVRMYQQVDGKPGWVLAWLQRIADHPALVAVVLIAIPILGLVIVTRWRARGNGSSVGLLRSPQRVIRAELQAERTDWLASQLRSGVSLDDALRMADLGTASSTADDSAGDVSEEQAVTTRLDARRDRTTREPLVEQGLSPMVAWALSPSLDNDQRARLLGRIADIYRQVAELNRRIFQARLMRWAVVLLGGLLTLTVGFLMFQPYAAMLIDAANAGGTVR